jgi:hypothetical protein
VWLDDPGGFCEPLMLSMTDRTQGAGEKYGHLVESGSVGLNARGNRKTRFRAMDHKSTHFGLLYSRHEERTAQPAEKGWLGGLFGQSGDEGRESAQKADVLRFLTKPSCICLQYRFD